ncbi:MAG TPA: efflux RND transporter permease subunit [Planctomycetota bacterium]|nr:efflux RND transporter permease subunit [Planctomycetota bacterium]
MSTGPIPQGEHGTIGWMIRHGVAPNLLMFACLIGGFLMARGIKQEVFPDFELDIVTITVPYPGASPEEVERGIVLVVEEAIRGTDGVKEVTAKAREGVAVIEAELFEGINRQKVYQEIQQEVNRITTLPEDAEEPEVMLAARWREVLNVEVYGNVGEWALREVVEQVRDRLLLDPNITQVSLQGVRAYEVHVAVPQENLRAYGLTLDQIAARISATALELPGGKVETRGGEILLRVTERREWANEFANIPVVTTSNGTVLHLRDIATVRDDFEDSDTIGTFNGARAMGIAVYRVGDQTPISVSDTVREVLAELEPDLPPGVHCDIRYDRSDIYRQRVDLLLRNAGIGLTLVMLLLAVFLEIRLAFWVMMGIPISFLGAFLFLPALGVSINMISLFAFILALGIVVDDAIVVGENIYEYRQRGMGAVEASIRATRGVAVPVTYSILTNIVAFLPLLALPGVMGKIWCVIPLVVCTVFTISWLEAMFILPAHLAHSRASGRTALGRVVHHWQQRFSAGFVRWVARYYGPLLRAAVRWRYLTVAAALALLAGVAGYVFSGRIGMILMPRVEADYAFATATLPVGCPLSQATAVRDRLERAANAVAAENGGERLCEGVFAVINENVIEMRAYLTPPEVRPISTSKLTDLWRTRVGEVPGTESVRFQSDRGGPGGGASLTVELSHRDIAVLDQASAKLAEILDGFSNVKDIDDGYTPGKQQLNFTLKPEGHSLGLTVREVARQVRNAFYGAEALRQQRGRSEIKVKVRFPEAERVSEADIENLMIRTPAGRDVPLRHVANVVRGRAYTDITRREGRRTVTVTADVVPIGDTSKVIATLNADVLPQLTRDFPGLGYGYEGRQADMAESMERLFALLILVLLSIFVMLALPFRSYIQPLIIMTAIPFGLVGAVFGHLIMGYDLSVTSLMGILALSGVVVNDAIVLIDHANVLRREGLTAFQAVTQAGIRRFRPIMLTTLTTFGGLAPMIFETSRQARFMIPMALSLGYGILFATAITLVLVPSLYLIAEDAKATAAAAFHRRRRAPLPAPDATAAGGS